MKEEVSRVKLTEELNKQLDLDRQKWVERFNQLIQDMNEDGFTVSNLLISPEGNPTKLEHVLPGSWRIVNAIVST